MPRRDDEADPRGLIHESYQIDGIDEGQCRSIFLDWAIGVPVDQDSRAYVEKLLTKFGPDFPDHPMTIVLKAALDAPAKSGRRGGASARRSQD
ncbi:MAG: hypothetical protein GKR98_03670 [Boseongicola sp.]|nr:MAG: hypothetical protein GKR98_03670 [Boseongicola sp.]